MAIDKSNPNTRRLITYWVKGEGAAKIRWGTDGSFDRCVRNLGDKVRDPEGLCAELHKEATGEWPAEKKVESNLDPATFDLEAEAWLDSMFDLELVSHSVRHAVANGVIRWQGKLAPAERATGDGRMFANNALEHRRLPMPFRFQRELSGSHGGSVVVATIDSFRWVGDGWEGDGEFLDPRIVPEVTEAIYLLRKGVIGPSVDLEPRMIYTIVPSEEEGQPPTFLVTEGRVAGATLVSMTAFADLEIVVTDADVAAVLASAGVQGLEVSAFAVNGNSWKSMSLGDRDQAFDADDAIVRLTQWAAGDVKKFASAFLWRDAAGDPRNKASYRLPVGDIINGKLVLIPHAVYAAAALLSGAHGGLPDIEDGEKEQIRKVITSIYDVLRDTFSDPRVMPPWQRGGRQGAEGARDAGVQAGAVETASEVWEDCAGPTLMASGGPLYPPRAWFQDPNLDRATGLRVTDDGRVFGHLASWGVCHTGIGNKCVMAPKSPTQYSYFRMGEVLCDDGSSVAVGKITLGAGHAHPALGMVPARDHYDNSAFAVAVVATGEDQHGIWVSGSLLPGVDEGRVAELRRSPLSGDWRRVNGHLELIGALAVNSPGFPVLRASASDELETLQAAAMVLHEPVIVDFDAEAGKVRDWVYLMDQVDELFAKDDAKRRSERFWRLFREGA